MEHASSPLQPLIKAKGCEYMCIYDESGVADRPWTWHWRDASLLWLKSLEVPLIRKKRKGETNERNSPVAVLAMPSKRR